MKASKSGITRRLARVIFLQLIFISVITVLGVIVAAKVVEGVMMRAALEGEAEHFWSHYTSNSSHSLPNTDNLLGYLQIGENNNIVPQALSKLPSGYGRVELEGSNVLVLVDEREINGNSAKLYLVFDEESVTALSFYFGVVPLSLVLIVIYFSAWFGFRQSSKAVSPLVMLAGRLRRFQPKQNVELQLENLKTNNTDDEINVLVDSLNNFTLRINHLIDKERRFTRDVSHELRTPLAVVKGSAEQLATLGQLDDRQLAAVQRIQRTVVDMNELVTALLLLARSDRVEMEIKDVTINSLIEKQMDQLELTHNADKHVTIHLNQKGPLIVKTNEQIANVVIGNLLRNAINYTRQGTVEISILDNLLSVCNRGEGVPKLDREEIFEPFVRGDHSVSEEGYGVGLDIVRRLCGNSGWEIDASYNYDKGMVFTIDFTAAIKS